MENQRTERKLAAILAADVVGYSRLMGHDEEGTLRRLKAHLGELVEPQIAAHRGRIVKRTGDGLLVDFASAVEAVRCAVAIQAGMADRNRAAQDDSRIEFRIGINLGDVIIEGDDIYGDGVNIAARLEALADPGGIFVSRAVRDSVRDKLGIVLEDLGEKALSVLINAPAWGGSADWPGRTAANLLRCRPCRTSRRSPCCRSPT